ncbi:MAG: hypothetical protein PHV68_04870, partial [Candidatus Gastranaerophilales bacterium]|nr:hypothetical protein [Candidatus Gastranaerophilales bacterium]
YESIHYFKLGHTGNEGPPGFPQLLHYFNRMLIDYGWGLIPAGLIGIYSAFKLNKKYTCILLTFPIIHLLFMCSAIVNFERNILFLFVVFGIFISLGLLFLYGKLSEFIKNSFVKTAVICCIIAVILSLMPLKTLAYRYNPPIDSRNIAVKWVNENIPANSMLLIPDELYFKTSDLRKDIKIVTYPVYAIQKYASFQQKFYDFANSSGEYYVFVPTVTHDERWPEKHIEAENLNPLYELLFYKKLNSEKLILFGHKKLNLQTPIIIDPIFSVNKVSSVRF